MTMLHDILLTITKHQLGQNEITLSRVIPSLYQPVLIIIHVFDQLRFVLRFRRVPVLLGAVFHVQHPGRDLPQTGQGLFARRPDVHPDHVAGLHEQLREPRDLHDIQPGVPEGVQKAHANRHLTRGRRYWQKFCRKGLRKMTTRPLEIRLSIQ